MKLKLFKLVIFFFVLQLISCGETSSNEEKLEEKDTAKVAELVIAKLSNEIIKYSCLGKNGTTEFMNIIFQDKVPSEVEYSTSKNKNIIDLVVSEGKDPQKISVSFPGDDKSYELTFSEGKVSCLNPDKTVQEFIEIAREPLPCNTDPNKNVE